MPNVTGRYSNTPYEDRVCTFCQNNEIGDEFHYLFIFEKFALERSRYIKSYYYHPPNIYKLTQLFESSDFKEMLNLAKFAEIIVKTFRAK